MRKLKFPERKTDGPEVRALTIRNHEVSRKETDVMLSSDWRRGIHAILACGLGN
jgi:hypothetical protein